MKITSYKKGGKTYYKFRIRLGNTVTTRSSFKTKNAAIFAYTKLIEDYQNEIDGNITYQKAYEEWLKVYKTTVKETTLQSTITIFNIHVLPVFGEYRLNDITEKMCQAFAISLSKFVKGKEYYNQAKRIMDFSMKIYNIPKNPFKGTILPKFKEADEKVDYLEPDDANKLIKFFDKDLYWKCLFRLMIYTGIRRGECLALCWTDIDLDNGELNINKTLGTGKDNKLVISTPKTKESNATIDLDKDTILLLKELKLQSDNTIIFPNGKGNYRRLSDIDNKLKKALKELNLKPIRVHDLRHTHASLLFASGADIKYVQHRLRHKSIKTTMNIYTHITKEKKEESLENFVKYMKKNA